MSMVEFAVGKVLVSTVESHRVIGESKGVAVRSVEVDPSLLVVGDYEAFQTIANNLIGNAVRYTEAGGEVVVSAHEEDGFVCIAVRDTGIGIPEEDQERVFERFYRVEKARSNERGGTGLGLAIVKHLVGAMKGTVKLKSKLGEGSEFEVRLPSATKKFEGP
jgi:signal transduction histidine kinase